MLWKCKKCGRLNQIDNIACEDCYERSPYIKDSYVIKTVFNSSNKVILLLSFLYFVFALCSLIFFISIGNVILSISSSIVTFIGVVCTMLFFTKKKFLAYSILMITNVFSLFFLNFLEGVLLTQGMFEPSVLIIAFVVLPLAIELILVVIGSISGFKKKFAETKIFYMVFTIPNLIVSVLIMSFDFYSCIKNSSMNVLLITDICYVIYSLILLLFSIGSVKRIKQPIIQIDKDKINRDMEIFRKRNGEIKDDSVLNFYEDFKENISSQKGENDAFNSLEKLKKLYDSGIISEEEYNEKRKKYMEMI